jgi:hypothetical protein
MTHHNAPRPTFMLGAKANSHPLRARWILTADGLRTRWESAEALPDRTSLTTTWPKAA